MHLVHVVPHRQLSYSRSFTVPDDHGDQPELKVSQHSPSPRAGERLQLSLLKQHTATVCVLRPMSELSPAMDNCAGGAGQDLH